MNWTGDLKRTWLNLNLIIGAKFITDIIHSIARPLFGILCLDYGINPIMSFKIDTFFIAFSNVRNLAKIATNYLPLYFLYMYKLLANSIYDEKEKVA